MAVSMSRKEASKRQKPAQRSRKPAGKISHAPSSNDRRYEGIHSNAIEWYNKVEPLFSDATRVPFNRIAGAPIDFNVDDTTNVGTYGNNVAIPGIMTFRFCPSVGRATNSNDAVNRAFTTMYGDIYSRTTGAMQFQQADLALWVLGMDSIITCIGAVKRLLGILNLYVSQNFYYPRALYAALTEYTTSDPSDIEAEFADVIARQDEIRRRLNNLILSFNSMNVPDFIDIFKRHYSLASNIWADSEAVSAQLYAFVPEIFYLYDDTQSSLVATGLAGYGDEGRGFNVFAMLNAIEDMLTAWRNSSDLGLIKGSVERAYQDSAFVRLEYVEIDNLTVPVFDRIMMYQINNATLPPCVSVTLGAAGGWNVTQSPEKNLLLSTPTLTFIGSVAQGLSGWNLGMHEFFDTNYKDSVHLLNSYDGNVDPEFIMEATRLMVKYGTPVLTGTTIADWKFAVPILEMGTEVITYCLAWTNIIDVTTKQMRPLSQPIVCVNPQSSSSQWIDAGYLTAIVHSKFDMAPLLPLILYTQTPTARNEGILGDVNVYTTIDTSALHGLNEAALQSIYTVKTQQFLK